VANAHSLGARPFGRAEYIRKFKTLTEGIVPEVEQERFLALVQRLPELQSQELRELNVQIPLDTLKYHQADDRGLF
jgi:2-methylcitrate dehydratase